MKPKILALTTLVLVSLVVLAACQASGHKTIKSTDYASFPGRLHKIIKATDYASSDWELLVEEAELHCKELNSDLVAVWVQHEGKQYALNGFAMRLFEDQGLVDIRRAGANQDARHYYYDSELIWKAREPIKSLAEMEQQSWIETAYGPKPNINNSPLMCEGVSLCGREHWGACAD